MATLTLEQEVSSVPTSAPTILSDDQIERLLQQAEERLQEKAGLLTATNTNNEDVLELATPVVQDQPRIRIPKLEHNVDRAAYLRDHHGVAKTVDSALVPVEQRNMANGLKMVSNKETNGKKINDQTTSGPQWFDLPKTELTPGLKRDLQLIEMRNVLDPHRHYKKNTRKGQIPTFSQVGTVIEGPTEWYSGRINNKDRSKNFVEEEMKNEKQTGRFKRKYTEIQDAKTSGKKAHYKKLMAKRGKKS